LIAVRELNSGGFKGALEFFHCRLFRVGSVFDTGNSIRRYSGLCGKFSNSPSHPSARHPKLALAITRIK
jgi:hypothetical protein